MILQLINVVELKKFTDGILVLLYSILAILCYREAKRSEDPKKTFFFYGYFMTYLLTSIANVYFALFDDQIIVMVGIRYVGEALVMLGLVFNIFSVETILDRTGIKFTLISLILVVLSIIASEYNLILLITMVVAVFGFILMIWLARTSSPDLEMIAIFLVLGGVMGISAAYLNSIHVNPFFSALGDLFSGLSLVLFLPIIYMTPEQMRELKREYFWAVMITVVCVFVLLGLYIYIELKSTVHIFGIIVFYIPVVIFLRSALQKSRNQEFKEATLTPLGIIARPSRLTEEEVSISKEKKICLVCKGKVGRYDIYLCPKCDSLYHHKCAKILEKEENACWACDAPFDESKPVNIAKKEEVEENEMDNMVHKEGNKNF